MKKHLFLVSGILILLSVTAMRGQTAPPAPLPAQLLSAKTVFLANARSNIGLPDSLTMPAYNIMYRELATTNHYQMATTPAAADLSMEFSVRMSTGPVMNGDSSGSAYIELVIRDAKTQALLWTVFEPIKGFAIREKAVLKIIDQATVKLAVNLKTLTSTGSTPAAPDATVPQP